VEVHVIHAVKDDVLRMANASFYTGRGEYVLFVVSGGRLVRRRVYLGESNYEHVEVVSGLEEGDEVVVSDMSRYTEKNNIRIK
jgi:HlyD family secretion protein